MNEARCSVNWKLYAPSGELMQFTLRDDDPDLHLALLDSYRAALQARGFSVSEPGLEAGEKLEEINAYVCGESKKGDACVYLYSSKTALQWRIATVYVEKFGELPFKPAGKKWEASAAPERGEAEKKGFLTTVPAFKIVLEAQEPDAEGKVHWRFARVSAGTPAAPAPVIVSQLVTSEPPPDPAWEKLIPATQERGKPAPAAVAGVVEKTGRPCANDWMTDSAFRSNFMAWLKDNGLTLERAHTILNVESMYDFAGPLGAAKQTLWNAKQAAGK
jgi:hypothetical protein